MKKLSQKRFTELELEKHRNKVVAQGELIRKLKEQIEIRDALIQSATAFITVLSADQLDTTGGEIVIHKDKISAVINAFVLDHGNDEDGNVLLRLTPRPPKSESEDVGS